MDYTKIKEMLTDEYSDVISYVNLYKETDDCIFRDIAHEEMIHAKHLENILKDAGVDIEGFKESKKKAETALEEV